MKKNRYTSNKVIGKLYDAVKYLNVPLRPDVEVSMDVDLIVPGFEKFLPYTINVYCEYARDLIGIMRMFGIQTEVDL